MKISKDLFSDDDLKFLEKAGIEIDFSRDYTDDEEFDEITDKMIEYGFFHVGTEKEFTMQRIYNHYKGFDKQR